VQRCFQFSTVLRVNADGSGTIDQRVLFTQAAVAQLRQLAALGGGARILSPVPKNRLGMQRQRSAPGF
jgi:hypothetical protein